MSLLVGDTILRDRLLAERRACGGDRLDEVWNGVYFMSPLADDDHQRIVTRFAFIFEDVIGQIGLGEVRAGVNVSDREDGWEHNFRIPDVAVRLNDGRARILETHWCGGPDFLIEVLSPGDRARDKLDFYAAIGVREALLIDRDPLALELYGLQGDRLIPMGVSRAGSGQVLVSTVVPLTFRLDTESDPPRIEVVAPGTGQRWRV